MFVYVWQQHPFNSPFFGSTRVSRNQKGKTNLDLLEQEIASVDGISWAICKSAHRSRQITMPTSQHSLFVRICVNMEFIKHTAMIVICIICQQGTYVGNSHIAMLRAEVKKYQIMSWALLVMRIACWWLYLTAELWLLIRHCRWNRCYVMLLLKLAEPLISKKSNVRRYL